MNVQEDFGPLENIAQHLQDCNYPEQAFISIGATAYAEFGEKNYLQSGDEIYVIAYDGRVDEGNLEHSPTKVIVHQHVE